MPISDANILDQTEKEKWAQISFALQALTHSEGWDRYTQLLGREENDKVHRLVNAPKEEHDWLCGYILGLRKAYTMPGEILKSMRGDT